MGNFCLLAALVLFTDSTGFVGYPVDPIGVHLRDRLPGVSVLVDAKIGRPAGAMVSKKSRRSWATPTELRDRLAVTGGDVVIQLGVNDWRFGETPESAAASAVDLALIARDEFGRRVWVSASFPVGPTAAAGREAWMREFRVWLIHLAAVEDVPVIDPWVALDDEVWATCGVTTCDGPGDGVHPMCSACRAAVATVVADAVLPRACR